MSRQVPRQGHPKVEQAVVKRRRLPAAERRQQIIDAVIEVASERGIPGTTIARVAETAGIGVGTVYRHFTDQKDMLRAAVESIATNFTSIAMDRNVDSAVEHIREMARLRTELTSANGGRIARLWLEFATASPQIGLQDVLIETQQRALKAVKDVCEFGVKQGTIRADVDLPLLTYMIVEQAWGADLSILLGMPGYLGRDAPTDALDKLLRDIAVDPNFEQKGPAEVPTL